MPVQRWERDFGKHGQGRAAYYPSYYYSDVLDKTYHSLKIKIAQTPGKVLRNNKWQNAKMKEKTHFSDSKYHIAKDGPDTLVASGSDSTSIGINIGAGEGDDGVSLGRSWTENYSHLGVSEVVTNDENAEHIWNVKHGSNTSKHTLDVSPGYRADVQGDTSKLNFWYKIKWKFKKKEWFNQWVTTWWHAQWANL
ncbi:MAG: hypothetical protein ABEI57_05775, partial [Halapricum sp.]